MNDETPIWDEEWCDDRSTGEELDFMDDILVMDDVVVDGSVMTHNMRQEVYTTQEDRADDYDLGKDSYVLIRKNQMKHPRIALFFRRTVLTMKYVFVF